MSVPLIVAGVLALIAGVALLATKRSGAAYATLGLAVLLLGGAFAFPQVDQEVEDLPRVSFTQPTDAAEVPAAEFTVEVQVVNPVPGGHLHLYVDDKLLQMTDSGTIDVSTTPGTHQLRVEYVDDRHISYTPPIQDEIEVHATE
jgi:hypothetical protein